jgi:prepilin peptidase CpaA
MELVENPIAHVTLVVVGVIASIYDVKWRLLPDWLTVGGMILGLLVGGLTGGWSGLGAAAGGLVAALLVFWLFWSFGMMGSGDVLLMGACGALLAWPLVIFALLYSTLAGALLGLVLAGLRGTLLRVFRNLWTAVTSTFATKRRRVRLAELPTEEVPYAVAIAIGSALAAATPYVPTLQLF